MKKNTKIFICLGLGILICLAFGFWYLKLTMRQEKEVKLRPAKEAIQPSEETSKPKLRVAKGTIVETSEYDEGILKSKTDAYGNVTHYAYGRPIYQADRDGFVILSYFYDALGALEREEGLYERTLYKIGNLVRKEAKDGFIKETYTYNEKGFLDFSTQYRRDKDKEGLPASAGQAGVAIFRTYYKNGQPDYVVKIEDGLAGQVIKTYHYEGNTLIWVKDEISGNIVHYHTDKESYEEDSQGETVRNWIYEKGRIIKEEYYEKGRKVTTLYYDPKGRPDYEDYHRGRRKKWRYGQDVTKAELKTVVAQLKEEGSKAKNVAEVIKRLENILSDSAEPGIEAKLLWVEYSLSQKGLVKRDFYAISKELTFTQEIK